MKLKFFTSGIALIILALTISDAVQKEAREGNICWRSSKIEVSIGGMTCTGCEQTVQSSVAKLHGIYVGKGIIYYRKCNY